VCGGQTAAAAAAPATVPPGSKAGNGHRPERCRNRRVAHCAGRIAAQPGLGSVSYRRCPPPDVAIQWRAARHGQIPHHRPAAPRPTLSARLRRAADGRADGRSGSVSLSARVARSASAIFLVDRRRDWGKGLLPSLCRGCYLWFALGRLTAETAGRATVRPVKQRPHMIRA
jgi:hypothetical protein